MSEHAHYLEVLNRIQETLEESRPQRIHYTWGQVKPIEAQLVIRTNRWAWLPNWCLRLGLPFVTILHINKVDVQLRNVDASLIARLVIKSDGEVQDE